jgi:hypothetical protein
MHRGFAGDGRGLRATAPAARFGAAIRVAYRLGGSVITALRRVDSESSSFRPARCCVSCVIRAEHGSERSGY